MHAAHGGCPLGVAAGLILTAVTSGPADVTISVATLRGLRESQDKNSSLMSSFSGAIFRSQL